MMKPEMQTATLFGTGTSVAIVSYSYWGTDNPIFAVIYAALAGLGMGFIGFHIGKIIAHPKGHLKPKTAKKAKNEPEEPASPGHKPITGDETLLDDLTT